MIYRPPGFPALFTDVTNDPAQKLREFDKKLVRTLDEFAFMLKGILGRGISFDDNIDCRRISVTSHATPGTEFSVAHGLAKTPIGYIVYGQDGAGTVYDGSTDNDATTLYLKSDGSSVEFRLIVF